MSWWRRLFGPPTPAPDANPPPATTAPRTLAAEAQAEAWLDAQVAAIARGEPPPTLAEIFSRIDTLVRTDHERLAQEWLDKLATVLADGETRDTVRLRAAELAAARGELGASLPNLDALTRRPSHAARAHMLLAEHHRRQGDLRTALAHLEAVLAIDVDHPNARVRAEALRHKLGHTVTSAAASGDTIAGPELGALRTARWQLIRQLGRGASGVVYLARDVELEREVAIKLLHPHLSAAAQSEARRLFFAEARVAAALRHPSVIAIIDLDEDQKRIVMEYAEGGTLRARLEAGPLPPRLALAAHVELLSALAAAHARGVVHRDLKPANLLLRGPGAGASLVLADFGVAHLATADRRAAAREPVGTLAYMAPEQRRGDAASPAADLFAAAVVLWECLVGAAPGPARPGLSPRHAGELAFSAEARKALGSLAEPLVAHLATLADPDPARRGETAQALARAMLLLEHAEHQAELDDLERELGAFRATSA